MDSGAIRHESPFINLDLTQRRMQDVIKVYCETSGYRIDLRPLEEQGRILVVTWPYENKNRKIRTLSKPSGEMTFYDLD